MVCKGMPGNPKDLSAPISQRFCDLRLRCPSRSLEIARFPKQDKAMLHCDLRVRWKVASDLRFRAAISEPKTPSFCRISGDLAQSTRKSLAIAIVRFWCAKPKTEVESAETWGIQPPNCQGQVSAEGILHLVNPNFGSNSGMRIFEPRILGPNSGVEFFGPLFSNKKSPLKNSPSRNSAPKIHIKKFTPEFGLKISHCTSAGPFC